MHLAVASYREPGSGNGFGDGLAPCSIVHSLCLICPDDGLVVVFAVSVIREVETLTHTPCFHYTPSIYADGYIVFTFPFVR